MPRNRVKPNGCVPNHIEFSASSSPATGSSITIMRTGKDALEFSSLADLQRSDDFPSILEDASKDRIFSIDYRALVFIDKPNKRSLRPDPGDMDGIVGRTKKRVYMRLNHMKDQDSKIGLVGDLEAVQLDDSVAGKTGGITALMQIRSGQHQVQFLKGVLDEYSIGMSAKSAKCSHCGMQYASWGPKEDLQFYPQCEHYPGTLSEDKKTTFEAVYNKTSITEVSAVGVPAVTGVKNYTGKSLSADDGEPDNEEREDMEKELQDKIKALESQLSAANDLAKQAQDFALKLAGDKLVESLRLTRAELSGDRIKKMISALGIQDTYEQVMTWPKRPELSPKAMLSQDTAETSPDLKAGEPADENAFDGELSSGNDLGDEAMAALSAARVSKQPKQAGKQPQKEPSLMDRLIARGELKAPKKID